MESAATTYRDRSGWLIVFGIVEVLIGLLCAALALLTTALMVMTMVSPPAANPAGLSMGLGPRAALPSLSMYVVLAVIFIALGIGSMRARSWAREWLAPIAWIWMLTGLSSIIIAALVWPSLIDFTATVSGLPLNWVIVMLLGGFTLTTVIHVVLPGIMILFYRSRDVIATCAALDANARWLSNRPTHILSLSLVYLLLAYSAVLLPVYGIPAPFFGFLLTGMRGLLVIIATTLVFLWLTWATFKQRPHAWGYGVVVTVIATIATTVTFARYPLSALIARMALSADEIGFMQIYANLDRSTMVWTSLVTWATVILYQLYVRQFFSDGRDAPDERP